MKPTLQILDAGETFYRQLEARPLVVGSGDDVDVRLTAAEVAPHHARIEPGDDGSFRIVDLGSEVGTRVNGEDVAQWKLSIGDRIEIAAAVLVVGQTVARKATAADVLDDDAGVARASAEVRRAAVRRRSDAPAGGRKLPVIAVLVVAITAGLFFVLRGGDTLPMRWGELVAMRRQGQVEDGRALAEQLRATWAKDDTGKNEKLDAICRDLDAIDRGLAEGRIRIRAEADSVSRADQLTALQEERKGGDETVRGVVARLLLSELDELRFGIRRTVPDDGREAAERLADTERSADPAAAAPGDAGTEAPLGEAERFVRDQLASIEELRAAGRYAEALESMRFALSATASEFAEPLRKARIRLRAEVGREMQLVVDRARDLVRDGDPQAVDRAIALLREEELRFPGDGEFGKIAAEQRALEDYKVDLERRATMTDVAAPAAPTLAEFRDLLTEARRCERAGDFEAAAEVVGRAADAMRQSDPLYAASLDGRHADLEVLARLAGYLREQIDAGREVVVELAERGSASVAVAGGQLEAGGEPLAWSAVAPASVAALLAGSKTDPEVLMGAAVHAYRAGDRATAEQLLARAVRADGALQPRIDGVIARGRGETIDEAGYRVVDGEFVAVRELEVRARAKELERTVARIARLPVERRDAALDEILAKGPQELDALVVALKSAAVRSAGRIENDAFRRHWEKVARAREQLDAARSHAKELIFDEVRYFYPYKPPAVSGEKASEYWKVQGEVDERVAAVREIWNDVDTSKAVPKRLVDEIAQLDWLVELLASFAERMPDLEERVAWARALPRDEPLELKSFCWDVREARERATLRKVLAFNEKKYELLSRSEIRQVEITNGYRMMFGHRPLALNEKLLEATRGHAQEMSKLGYFSHYSPTPGRKSPFDRMKLAGYTWGVSENIANHLGAESAHDGWIHSSGHHRNLLMPSHREFAVGNDGRIWVQNFGRGDDFVSDPDWSND